MASAGKPPSAPDPRLVIQAQEQANHYNQTNPFGSATWSKGPDGQSSLNQSYSPQMQQAVDRAFTLSQKDPTPQYVPQGLSELSSAVLGKVGSKYGLTPGQGFDTNMKNAYKPPPQIQPGQVNGQQFGQGMAPPQGGPMGQASSMPSMGGGMPQGGGFGGGMPPPQAGGMGAGGGQMNPAMLAQLFSSMQQPQSGQSQLATPNPAMTVMPQGPVR